MSRATAGNSSPSLQAKIKPAVTLKSGAGGLKLILGVLALGSLTAVAVGARAWWKATPGLAATTASAVEKPVKTVNEKYLRRSRLTPHQRELLKALGDRLEKPGKERLTLLGTITRLTEADRSPAPISLTLEFPDRLRLEEIRGNKKLITAFDGSKTWGQGKTLKRSDEDLVETLLFDSVEHFLLGQLQGYATRLLGTNFRLDDGTNPNYAGPFYDIYEVTDELPGATEPRTQTKLYYFNSATALLERVRYESDRDGVPVSVEILFDDWQAVGGQGVPRQLTRRENDQPVLQLNLTVTGFSARQADNLFAKP